MTTSQAPQPAGVPSPVTPAGTPSPTGWESVSAWFETYFMATRERP